jgi:hypothetical protein
MQFEAHAQALRPMMLYQAHKRFSPVYKPFDIGSRHGNERLAMTVLPRLYSRCYDHKSVSGSHCLGFISHVV